MPHKTAPKKTSSNLISKQTGISLGVLLMLILPLITACVFVVTANNKIATLENNLKELKQDFKEHVDKCYDGESLEHTLDKLKYRMGTKLLDRWTKADDDYYMERFVRKNNLKSIEHKRIIPLPKNNN